MSDLVNAFPRKKIKIEDILLWNNNPRLVKSTGNNLPLDRLEQEDSKIYNRMKQVEHDVSTLVKAILSTGWMDQDVILVGYYPPLKKYFVLEGNRRVTALRMIKEDRNSGYKTMKQVAHPRNIQDGDSVSFKTIFSDGITCVDGGDATKWTEEHWKQIKQYLSIRHISGQKNWGPYQTAYNIYVDYMDDLSKTKQGIADGVNIDNPDSFFIENDVVKSQSQTYGISLAKTKNYLYLVAMRNQFAERLVDLGGGIFPESKTSLISDGILKSPPLKKRYGFDPKNGKIVSGDQGLDLFLKLCFDIGNESKALITAATAGESNLRTYSYVLDKDPSGDNQTFIKMIEADRKTPDEAKSDLIQENGDFKLIVILQKVKKLLGTTRLSQLSSKDLDSDTLRELMEDCIDIFEKFKRNLEEN
jgi:hypothetical protein